MIFRPFRPYLACITTRGDAFRCASRLPLALIFRAFGAPACAAPSALQHVPRLRRSAVLLSLENVPKLKLTNTSGVDVADIQIAGIEPEVVERRIRHIARSRSKLRCVQ